MSTFLRKKLHLCFSSSGVHSPSIPSSPIVVTNHNPPSQSHHHTPSIFINNFNSLYDHLSVSSPLHRGQHNTSVATALTTPKSGLFNGALHSSPRKPDDENDGQEEEEEDEESEQEEEDSYVAAPKLLSGGTAVMMHIDSPDPYRDFGMSMREMVEARDITRYDTSDREYLHELLFCYLSLNPKHTHKFIVSAFADTLLWLLSPSSLSSPEEHLHFLSHSI